MTDSTRQPVLNMDPLYARWFKIACRENAGEKVDRMPLSMADVIPLAVELSLQVLELFRGKASPVALATLVAEMERQGYARDLPIQTAELATVVMYLHTWDMKANQGLLGGEVTGELATFRDVIVLSMTRRVGALSRALTRTQIKHPELRTDDDEDWD